MFSAVGVGYPTYASLKMLAEDKTEDAAMWITYWCLFSLLKVVMNPLDFILGFLPFYFYLKLVLLVWLFSPTTKGAGVVYTGGGRLLRLPAFGGIEVRLDRSPLV